MKKRLFTGGLGVIVFITVLLIFHTAFAQEEETSEEVQEEVTAEEEVSAEKMEESPLLLPIEGTEVAVFRFQVSPRFQSVIVDKESSRAIEYRSLPEGLYIDSILFHYGSHSQELSGGLTQMYLLTNLSDDGHGRLDYWRYGLLEAEIGISKFPRHYGDSFTTDVATQRDNYNLLLKFTPGDRLLVTTNLTIENRQGKKPLTAENITAMFSDPTAILEIKEPVDYNTATIGIGLEYLDEMVDIQLNNDLQIFSTDIQTVSWPNPHINGAAGLITGLDDYSVHTLSLKPSVKFTNNIKLISSLIYTKVTGRMYLVPFSTAGIGNSFSQGSVDSDVRNLTFSSLLSTRPWTDVRLNLRYRYNAYKNDTPTIEGTPSYVMLDGNTPDLIRYPRIPRYTSYAITRLGLESTWSLTNRLVLDADIENKDISRSQREVDKENEKRISLAVNSILTDQLSGRLGYTYSRRRGNYDPEYYNTEYDPNPANSAIQHPLMRAFDLSSRDSNTLTARLNYSPAEALDLWTTLSLESADHPGVAVGRSHSSRGSVSASAQYRLLPGFLIFSDYIRDRREIDTNPAYPDFTQPLKETIEYMDNVFAAGFDLDMDQWLSLRGKYSRYTSAETSISLPETSIITDTFELTLSFKPDRKVYSAIQSLMQLEDVSLNAGYYLEHYKRKDYALDNFPDISTDSFLGIRAPDYTLHIVSVSLSLYF